MAGKAAVPKDPWGLFGWGRGLAIAAAVIHVAVGLVFAVVWVATGQIMFVSETGTFADFDPWFIAELIAGLGSLLGAVLYVVFFILLLMLSFQLVRNLKLWEEEEMRTNPWMTILWYLVPFANLILPPRIVTEMWRATFPDARLVSGGPSSIGLWWGAILAAFATGYGADRFLIGAANPTMFGALTLASIFATAAAMLLFLPVFGPMAKEQRARVRAGAAAAG